MKYETMSGETIELPEPSAAVAAFIQRAQALLADAAVTEGDFIGLLYGRENPILDQTKHPERGTVTAAVFADPWYAVVADMLGKKRAQQDGVRFTMTVPEAAAALGFHESAVRQAIAARRLVARKVGGSYLLDPQHVAAYQSVPRGPKAGSRSVVAGHVATPQADPPKGTYTEESPYAWAIKDPTPQLAAGATSEALEARVGSATGCSFRIKGAKVVGGKVGSARAGRIDAGWERIAVLASKTGSGARYWELEPAVPGTRSKLVFEGFFLRGAFRVAAKNNNEQRSRELFAAFKE